MLPGKDRDWLLEKVLEIRELERRRSEWSRHKPFVGYFGGAFALIAIGGIFGNREIGSFAGILAFIISIGLGFYFYEQETQRKWWMKRDLAIREKLERHGLITYDGLRVSRDEKEWFDPMKTSSYE